jgi:hypothetical protein
MESGVYIYDYVITSNNNFTSFFAISYFFAISLIFTISLISLLVLLFCISFSCLIALARTSSVAGGLRQRLRGHQSFGEASLLSKLAVTQQTHVQRLSTENKGGLPFIPFREGYRNGGYNLSHT